MTGRLSRRAERESAEIMAQDVQFWDSKGKDIEGNGSDDDGA